MSALRKDLSMGFTTELLSEGAHICMIFDNEAQRRKIVSEFLAAGIMRPEKFLKEFASKQSQTVNAQSLDL